MKKLNVCPSTLQKGYDTYSPAARKALFDGREVSHIFAGPSPDADSPEALDAIRNVGRISLSGAQPKFSVVIDVFDTLRYTREREQGLFILKPRPTGYHIINREYCAANEHVTMQIASQVYGIETAANGLCFFDNGEPAYITRRFDVHNRGKYKQEDFAALLGYTKDNAGANYKYDKASYEECAGIIHRYVKAALVDIQRFFRLILFNFVTSNDDAHLKNFSLIEYGSSKIGRAGGSIGSPRPMTSSIQRCNCGSPGYSPSTRGYSERVWPSRTPVPSGAPTLRSSDDALDFRKRWLGKKSNCSCPTSL